jgi:hypothetical protein
VQHKRRASRRVHAVGVRRLHRVGDPEFCRSRAAQVPHHGASLYGSVGLWGVASCLRSSKKLSDCLSKRHTKTLGKGEVGSSMLPHSTIFSIGYVEFDRVQLCSGTHGERTL